MYLSLEVGEICNSGNYDALFIMLYMFKGCKTTGSKSFVEESNAESNKQNQLNISFGDKYFTSSVRSKNCKEIYGC